MGGIAVEEFCIDLVLFLQLPQKTNVKIYEISLSILYKEPTRCNIGNIVY